MLTLLKKLKSLILERLNAPIRYVLLGFNIHNQTASFGYFGSRVVFNKKLTDIDTDILSGLMPEQACFLGILIGEQLQNGALKMVPFDTHPFDATPISFKRNHETVTIFNQSYPLKTFISERSLINSVDSYVAYSLGIAFTRSREFKPLLSIHDNIQKDSAEIISMFNKK